MYNTYTIPCTQTAYCWTKKYTSHSVFCCVEVLYIGQLWHDQHLFGSSEPGAESAETLLDLLRGPETISALFDDAELVPGLLEEVGRVLDLSQSHCRVLLDERL